MESYNCGQCPVFISTTFGSLESAKEKRNLPLGMGSYDLTEVVDVQSDLKSLKPDGQYVVHRTSADLKVLLGCKASMLSVCFQLSDTMLTRTANFMRRKLVIKPQFNVLILWVGIFVFSLFPVFFKIPDSYFSDKRNILNMWFVKWGWLWTLLVAGPYMVSTAFVYGGESWKKSVFRAVLRLICGTVVWAFWTKQMFPFVENMTGVCMKHREVPDFTISDKLSCKRDSGTWKAFDISGHCFLLTYAILIISSEIQIHKHWHKIPSKAPVLLQLGSKSLKSLKLKYYLTLKLVTFLFVLNCVFLLLWHLMLIVTCIYFHNFMDKTLATGLGILSWMATYNEWYKKKFSPGLPGKSVLFPLLSTSTKPYM